MGHCAAALAVLVAMASGRSEVETLTGEERKIVHAGVASDVLIPFMSVDSDFKTKAKDAQMDAHEMKIKGLGEDEALHLDGDGEAAANQAKHQAKAAVDGVKGAKKAMQTALKMLEAAGKAAHQSEVDAAHSVQADHHDMTNLVQHAVQAAQAAESLKIESRKHERLSALAKQDAAYRHAEEELTKKRDDALRLGDAELAHSTEQMHLIEAEGPGHRTNVIAERMQKATSPQKLAALSSGLLHTMGAAAVSDEAIASVTRVGEALPSKMSHDEEVFDQVLNKMKQAEKKMRIKHSSHTQPLAVVSVSKLQNLADSQLRIANQLHHIEKH